MHCLVSRRATYYIKEFTGEVDNGKISNYRINAKVTFDLETERAG
jgi:flavin-binding protein dodecin